MNNNTKEALMQQGLFKVELPKSLPLRQYQWDSINELNQAWQSHKNILVQQPTGAGKSLIIAQVVLNFINQNKPVLLVAHKIELIKQLRDHCLRWFPSVDVGIIADKSQFKRNYNAMIQIASVQAFGHLKPEDYPSASLVVFDEAHHCHARSYAKLFAHYEDSAILGVTATPMRIDGRGLRFLFGGERGFDYLVKGVSVNELTADEHLAPFKFFAAKSLVDPAEHGIHTKMGDYVQSELEELTEKVLLFGDVVTTWERHAKGLRTVVYPVSVKYSKELCQEFNEAGYPAEHLDAKTHPMERERILERFRQGETLILCQHSIVIEGVDVPDIGAVIFARPTKSLTIWFQAIGRSLRPAPNKPHAVIIDHTTTHQNLPFPDCEIDWSLDPISLPKGTKHALTCDCGHVYRATAIEIKQLWSQCPSCQSKFKFKVGKGGEVKKKSVEILPADFGEVILTPPSEKFITLLEELEAEKKAKGYKPIWIYYRVSESVENGEYEPKLADLKLLAEKLGYKVGWGFYKYLELKKIFESLPMKKLVNS
jgi:superfamily II DNA or RNA helicase